MKMEYKRGYRPYEAFSYLEPGVDYKVIDWADWDWAGRHVIELDAAQEARVERPGGTLHRRWEERAGHV